MDSLRSGPLIGTVPLGTDCAPFKTIITLPLSTGHLAIPKPDTITTHTHCYLIQISLNLRTQCLWLKLINAIDNIIIRILFIVVCTSVAKAIDDLHF